MVHMRLKFIIKVFCLPFLMIPLSCVSNAGSPWPDWVTQKAMSDPGHGPITMHQIEVKILPT